MPFPLPKGKPEFSKLEEAILQKWKSEKTFEKSVESRPADNPYRFYDGPPFITGTPHYGSLLSSIIKDVVPRYQTMLGKRVERVWGWDCHGLPIEQKVQKKLGLESNKEIEESEDGIQGFIDECYNYTGSTSAEWNWYVDHIGRWVDMEGAYRTMDQNYMESVMWVFKQIWEKGYVYEGKRVSWYSWKLSTPISNFEIAMDDSYQDVQDPAVTIKFPINDVRKGAGVVIQDTDGKLLMIKNKKDGLWRLPGGKIEPEESYHAGAARELLEETGIACELTPYCSTYCGYRGEFYEALSFRGVVPVGQKVTLEKDKFTDYEYFALDALPVMSEIHRMEHDLIDFLTGVREPVIVPETSEPRTTNILAWTTTPWTLPMHMALAVNNDLEYVAVYHAEEVYILAASRVETVFKGKGDHQILCTIPGHELVGLKYQAPFNFYQEKIPADKNFVIYHADFVTDTDGTGIAHEAPEFGDVDFQLAKEKGIHITSAIDEAGKYTAEILDYQGQLYLDCIEPICERLKSEGKLFKKESITHRVPYCPRSNTPLIQKAQKSWFIDIQRIKKELIEQNENINWFPDHFKHGRFLKSLESAPDWCISRSRFWGTPMPVWHGYDKDGVIKDTKVFASRKEIEDISGMKIENLHRPTIDTIIWKEEGLTYRRVPEVLDVWMDSASMPYAQVHYPFENVEKMEASFPADFIAEYTGQIRAWFYVMHVIGVLVKGSPAFKNVAVTGVINGTDGRKMSKSFGNYPDPRETIEKYGADAIRFYLMSGPIMRGEDMNFSEQGIAESIKRVLLPLWNAYTFFATYANIDGWEPDGTEIYLIRHGQTKNNAEHRLNGGSQDQSLNDVGRKQGEEVRIALEKNGFKPDVLVVSSLKRAQETAKIIFPEREFETTDAFMEQYFGEYDGMTFDEAKKKSGVTDWFLLQKAYRNNSRENVSQFSSRVVTVLQELVTKNPGKKIVIVGHGGIARVLREYSEGVSHEEAWYNTMMENGAVIRFSTTPKTHELDTWIMSQLHTLMADVRASMDAYDTQKTCEKIAVFLDKLNNWYIRRNRRRFWKNGLDQDKKSAYETLHEVLTTVCQLLAPICPFITEYLYGNLTYKNEEGRKKN